MSGTFSALHKKMLAIIITVLFSSKFSYFSRVHEICLTYYLLEDWDHILSISDASPMVSKIHSNG